MLQISILSQNISKKDVLNSSGSFVEMTKIDGSQILFQGRVIAL